MKIIILAFIISISLHFFLFKKYNSDEFTKNNQIKEEIVKKSDVKFVKLKKEEPIVNKPIDEKVEPVIEKKIEAPKIQKEVIKKESPKKEFEKKEDSGEDFVRQIKGILGLKDAVTNINIPNYGQVENIEKGAIVETNAFFTTNYVSPIMAGNVDDKVLELMKPHIENQSLIVKACLSRDKELLYKAFRNDPQGASLKEEDAGALFSEMFEALEKFN